MSGRGLIAIIQASMISELSSIFQIFRFFTKENKKLLYISEIFFLITFFFSRILLFPFTYFACFKSFQYYEFFAEGTSHVISIVILFFLFLLIFVLNIYWFHLIIKTLMNKF